jgi:hypothetical protein
MKRNSLIISFLFAVKSLCAQRACDIATVHSMPGSWVNNPVNITDHSPADAARERPILKSIFDVIRANFKSEVRGGEVRYIDHAMLNAESFIPFNITKKIDAARVSFSFLSFSCVNGKVEVGESSVGMIIGYNQFPFKFDQHFFEKKSEEPDGADPNVYTTSTILPQFKNGEWNFYGGFRNGSKVFAYDTSELEELDYVYRVIAKPGLAPVVPMTKQEYFTNHKKKLRIDMEDNDLKIKSLAKTADPNLDAATKQKLIDMYEQMKEYDSKIILSIEEVEKTHTSEQLKKPAVFREEQGKYIETPDFMQSEFYILKPNPDYFNFNLPKSSLQLCSIKFTTWGLHYGDVQSDQLKATYQNFINELFRMDVMKLVTEKMQTLMVK